MLGMLAIGCKSSAKAPSAPPGPPTGSAASAPASEARGCDLVGTYRLRFASNGTDGWWWRFAVTETNGALSGNLTTPIPVLGIEQAGPVDIRRDTSGCAMIVTASGTIGDMIATLRLDEPTNKVTGELTRAKPRDAADQAPAPMSGVRDAPGAKPTPAGACVEAGIYELALDPKAKYQPDNTEDKCDTRLLDKLRLRLEHLGPELYGDALNKQGAEIPGGLVVKSFKGCDVELEHVGMDESTRVVAKLTFSGTKVTGTATTATYRMLQDGEDGESMWNCTAENVPITGRKR